MSASAKLFVAKLATKYKTLEAAFSEHKMDNFGMVLPHLVMADFCRVVCNETDNLHWVQDFLSDLEKEFSKVDDDEVSNLIAVSFIENLPSPSENAGITAKLPPKMRWQYCVFYGS